MKALLILANRLRILAILDNVWVVNLVSWKEVDVLGHRGLGHATTVSGIRSLHARIASMMCARSSTMLAELDYAVNAMMKGAPVAICAGWLLLGYVSIAGNLCAARIRMKTISAAGNACLR